VRVPWPESAPETSGPPVPEEGESALLVRAGGADVLVRLRDLHELTRFAPLTPLPGAPQEVLGLHNVRGEILTVLCLPRLLGRPGGGARYLAVVEARGIRFALAFEAASDAVRLGRAPVAAAEAGPAEEKRGFLRAAALPDGRPCSLVDVERIAESVFEPEAFDDNDLLEPEGAAR
jgi:chemotaxis signal transduction protein